MDGEIIILRENLRKTWENFWSSRHFLRDLQHERRRDSRFSTNVRVCCFLKLLRVLLRYEARFEIKSNGVGSESCSLLVSGLNEPLSLLGDVVTGGRVDDGFVGVQGVVSALVFLRQVFALVARLVAVDEDGHDGEQQKDDQQQTCGR